jgi:uncharacterized protein (DUF58 family)
MLWRLITSPWRTLRWMMLARPIHFTRFGWFYVLFSLGVGAAAINTGNNLLYLMLGLLLGFIIISGVLSDSCLWGISADFAPSGDLFAGQPSEWDITVSTNWFPGIIVHVETRWEDIPPDPPLPKGGGRRPGGFLFFWIPRHGTAQARFTLTPERRGAYPLKQVRYSTRFPFGLFEKSHQEQRDETWVVFPRVQRLSRRALQAAGMNLADEAAGRKGLGATPFDLREYQAGDSQKKIHWKASAKRGELIVADMEDESSTGQRVHVSGWPSDSDVESFISFLASLISSMHREAQPVGLTTPGFSCPAERSRGQLKKILTYLALVDPKTEQVAAHSTPSRLRSIDALALWNSRQGHGWQGAA